MKRLLFIAFPYLLLLFGNVNFKEDFYLARAEYYFESPNGQQVLTFISVENIFETIFGDKMKSGIYMFIGHIDSSSKLPDEFLKLKYSDFPIGISWEDTIVFSYGSIEENRFKNSSQIDVYSDIRSDKYKQLDSLYRTKSVFKRTAYSIDKIFSN